MFYIILRLVCKYYTKMLQYYATLIGQLSYRYSEKSESVAFLFDKYRVYSTFCPKDLKQDRFGL